MMPDGIAAVPLRILHLEDTEADRFFVARTLKDSGIPYEIQHVETRDEFLNALERGNFDIVLADQSLPSFDGVAALHITKQKSPNLPFIFVTGSMGEEKAIELIKSGATDYVLKDNFVRLVPAIERALQEKRAEKERARAEKQIKEQATLLDRASDAIIVCDLECRIIFWNKGAERTYGWSANEAAGKKLSELLAKENSAKVDESLRHTFETGEWDGELLYSSKDGKIIVTQSHWTFVRDDSGKPQSILSINTDITEKKQLEIQYLRAQRMETIGILAGGIAHDLNNVLSPILMVSQLLRMQNPSPESAELLDMLDKSAQHGADLIKQILSFARGVEGQHVEIQVGHLIRDLQKMLKETLPRSIQIDIKLARDLWTIKGVPTHIHQVLMNLGVNARDAMPEGGRLTLAANNVIVDEAYSHLHPDTKLGPYVLIAVTDTGIGIPPEIMQRIYDPFFTTKEAGKGTGLGLSTVKGIVKSHGGFIHVYSEPGKGTSFKTYFPAVTSPSTALIEEQQANRPRGAGECVLVVDDEAAVLETTKKILERYGYTILTARDGAEGVAEFVKNQDTIQIILTDLMMPIMDGPAMIRTLLKMKPNVRIIALSGLLESHKISDIIALQQIELIQKPYSTEELLSKMKRLLAKR